MTSNGKKKGKVAVLSILALSSLLIFSCLFHSNDEPSPSTASHLKSNMPATSSDDHALALKSKDDKQEKISDLNPALPAPAPRIESVLEQPNEVVKTMQYGNGEGEIGVARGEGHPPVGPESFTIGNDGSILLADKINHRVLVLTQSGELVRSITVPDISLDDLTVDSRGNLYVVDFGEQKLFQFKADGTPLASIPLQGGDIVSRGYVHVEGEFVYFANSGSTDILIGQILNGSLQALASIMGRNSDGIHAGSGNIYAIDVTRGESFRVFKHDDEGQMKEQVYTISMPDVSSATFVGESQDGQFHIQVERNEEEGVALEVLTFDEDGHLYSTTTIPENDYDLWTTKLLAVGNDGAIVQFLPQDNQATMRIIGKD